MDPNLQNDKEIQNVADSKQKVDRPHPYAINTGALFVRLSESYESFSPSFLKGDVQRAFKAITVGDTLPLVLGETAEEKAYLSRQRQLYAEEILQIEKEGGFPFPSFFLHTSGKEVLGLYHYDDGYGLIEKDVQQYLGEKTGHYDLFFALKLFFTDPFEVNDFLQYHLKHSFQMKWEVYTQFLNTLSVKYSDFLSAKHTPLLELFLQQKQDAAMFQKGNSEEVSLTHKGWTLQQKILFFHYSFHALGYSKNAVDASTAASLIRMLIEKEGKNSDVRNTDIYKKFLKPLSKGDGQLQKDLSFVRTHMEKCGLHEAITLLDKDLQDISNENNKERERKKEKVI